MSENIPPIETLNTCDTCKWWDTEPPSPDGFGFTHRMCKNPKLDDCKEGADGAVGGEIATDKIYCGPKFGCIHWEAR